MVNYKMSFLEMSPLAVVAVLVVIVLFAMSSGGGRTRAGKSSLTGSLSKELQSIGKSVKKTTGKGGLGKLTKNKMLVGILVGFGLCWAYGKFSMEGFDTRGECESECPEAATLCKDHFCRMNPPPPGEGTVCATPDTNNTTPCQTVGSATTGVIGEDTAQQLMDQGGVQSVLAGLSNASAVQSDRDNRSGDAQTLADRICGLDRAGLIPREQQMFDTICRTGQGEN